MIPVNHWSEMLVSAKISALITRKWKPRSFQASWILSGDIFIASNNQFKVQCVRLPASGGSGFMRVLEDAGETSCPRDGTGTSCNEASMDSLKSPTLNHKSTTIKH